MINILYIFLPAIILLGIITSYTDIKFGKIKNNHILLALLFSFAAYIYLISTLPTYRIEYIIELIIMLALSIFTGFIIWYSGLWTAGDAKLFFAFSALIPLSVYKYGYVPYFASSTILLNTFIPFALFFSIYLMFKTTLKQKIFYLKESLKPKRLFALAVSLFALIWMVSLLFSLFGVSPNFFITIFIIAVLLILIEKVINIKVFYIIIAVAILRIFFDKTFYTFESLRIFFLIFISFIIIRFFLLNMSYNFLTKSMDIKLLKPGMVPAEQVYIEDGNYKKESLLYFSFLSHIYEKSKKKKLLFKPISEGLSEMDIKKLKSIEKKVGFEHFKVYQTIPFAPFMFAGTLLTIIIQGNLFFVLKILL